MKENQRFNGDNNARSFEKKWSNAMFEIIGTRNEIYQEKIGERFLDHYSDEVVATFDDKEDAEQYIRDSRLKKPYSQLFSSYTAFKKASLLRCYESARVEVHYPEEHPHNPVI